MPWYPAFATIVAPAWTFPSPTGRTRSAAAGPAASHRSFDVLYLFPQFFDLRFNFQSDSGDGQRFTFHARGLGKHGVGFAMHFLQQEIEFLTKLAGAIQQLAELLQVAAQAVQFFADVAALRQHGR